MKRQAPWWPLAFCATVLAYSTTILIVGIAVGNELWVGVNAACAPLDAFFTVYLARQCAKARR